LGGGGGDHLLGRRSGRREQRCDRGEADGAERHDDRDAHLRDRGQHRRAQAAAVAATRERCRLRFDGDRGDHGACLSTRIEARAGGPVTLKIGPARAECARGA